MDFERELLILELEDEWQEYLTAEKRKFEQKPKWYRIVTGDLKPNSESEYKEAREKFYENTGVESLCGIDLRLYTHQLQSLKTF